MARRVLHVVAATDTGRRRAANEDSLLIGDRLVSGVDLAPIEIRLGGVPAIVAVADGMGGHNGGAFASALACTALGHAPLPISVDAIAGRLRSVDREIVATGRGNPELAGMGTTIAGLVVLDDAVFIFNVGDSSVLRIDDGLSFVVSVSDAQDVGFPRTSSVLFQCLGGSTASGIIEPHISRDAIEPMISYLVCSDGLTDMLTLWEIDTILATHAGMPVAAVSALVTAANQAGGHDNISVVLCTWRDVTEDRDE